MTFLCWKCGTISVVPRGVGRTCPSCSECNAFEAVDHDKDTCAANHSEGWDDYQSTVQQAIHEATHMPWNL